MPKMNWGWEGPAQPAINLGEIKPIIRGVIFARTILNDQVGPTQAHWAPTINWAGPNSKKPMPKGGRATCSDFRVGGPVLRKT